MKRGFVRFGGSSTYCGSGLLTAPTASPATVTSTAHATPTNESISVVAAAPDVAGDEALEGTGSWGTPETPHAAAAIVTSVTLNSIQGAPCHSVPSPSSRQSYQSNGPLMVRILSTSL